MIEITSGISEMVTDIFIPKLVISKYWQFPIIYILCLNMMSNRFSNLFRVHDNFAGLWKDKRINNESSASERGCTL